MQNIHKILIGVAFSPNLQPNIYEAVRLANMFDCELVGVHVGEKSDYKEKRLQEVIDRAPPLKKTMKTFWQKGKPVKVILETCRKESIDLLILGALQQ